MLLRSCSFSQLPLSNYRLPELLVFVKMTNMFAWRKNSRYPFFMNGKHNSVSVEAIFGVATTFQINRIQFSRFAKQKTVPRKKFWNFKVAQRF